ncbi:MAG: DUF501 domain-containing protein [Actinomycetaceae bacterium]|nr:DUF501 domain-containing protein [Actinomycetaceae bacterium]
MTEYEPLDAQTLQKIAPNASALQDGDKEAVAEQLGRPPRGLVGIGARCACGKPAVTITMPRLPDGTPFPTLFYLCLPELVKEVSRLEATGIMSDMSEEILHDEAARVAHQKAHESYVARRAILGEVPEIADVSAGGMPERVKCLHALVGYALAAGEGICPAGDKALAMMKWDTSVCHCSPYDGDEK